MKLTAFVSITVNMMLVSNADMLPISILYIYTSVTENYGHQACHQGASLSSCFAGLPLQFVSLRDINPLSSEISLLVTVSISS